MEDKDLVEKVTWRLLSQSIDSLESYGRYWPGAITSAEAKVLDKLLKNEGFTVHFHEVKPEWEYVFDASETPWKEIQKIAQTRSRLRNSGIDEKTLPK